MANEIDMITAQKIYNTVCNTLDGMKLTYEKHEKDLVITLGHRGDDMNHSILIVVNAKQNVITIIEQLPFKIDKEKALDMCVAICYINKNLVSGGFTYDFDSNISFEITQFYNDREINEAFIERMLMTLVVTVEEYDDKLLALNKGYMKVTDFLTEN